MHLVLDAILINREGREGLVGVTVVAGALFPSRVQDVCVAFVECKFTTRCRQEVIVELDVCFGLGVYRFMFGNW